MISAMLEEIYSQSLNCARIFDRIRIYLFLIHSATVGTVRGVLTRDEHLLDSRKRDTHCSWPVSITAVAPLRTNGKNGKFRMRRGNTHSHANLSQFRVVTKKYAIPMVFSHDDSDQDPLSRN
jgi:hypothetical protein